jgi:putative restriction endonuclease
MTVLRLVLPAKYSPLQPNGNGLQSVYLAAIPDTFAEVLAGLIGPEARNLVVAAEARATEGTEPQVGDDLDYWEHQIEQVVERDQQIPETEREAIIRARRGQGLFKQRVVEIERRCRITGVDNLVHLIASHCKPWRTARIMRSAWMDVMDRVELSETAVWPHPRRAGPTIGNRSSRQPNRWLDTDNANGP